jgi:hemoglobin-like flavoprotein
MTPMQIQLVQATWAKVVPIKDTAAEIFYGKLFEMDPGLKPLFKGDMKAQGTKLMSMINTAVNGLTRLDQIVPAVESLGKRHVGYGVKDQHYDTVAGALLYTLEMGLGPAFTPEVKQSWTEAYMLLAGVMKKAASTAPA